MPQESISQILNNRYREFELARNENEHSKTSILDDQTIDIGEFYGCLCHQAPQTYPITATDNQKIEVPRIDESSFKYFFSSSSTSLKE